MLQQSRLDSVFSALGDPTRRAIVERLASGSASVTELSAPFAMSLSAVGQHVQMLEACGLVRTRKIGRVRSVELCPERLAGAEQWFRTHRQRWQSRLDRLATLLSEEPAAASSAVSAPTNNPPHKKNGA